MAAATVHLYQLTIFIGLQQPSMKDSQICVRLIGEEGLDACHDLNLDVSNVFQRGGVDQFVITSFLDLGY